MTDGVYVGLMKHESGIDCESPLPEVSSSKTVASLEVRVASTDTDIGKICKQSLLKNKKYDILKKYKGGVKMNKPTDLP